jgi:serine/threonine protein kinase
MAKQTTMRDFLPISKIGEGSFSSVYKVQRVTDGCIYALKKVRIYRYKGQNGVAKPTLKRECSQLDSDPGINREP